MNAKKILAASLVALLAVASVAPAFAAEKENVMLNGTFTEAVNLKQEKEDTGLFANLNDGLYATGPTHFEGATNCKAVNSWMYHDINGVEADDGMYLGMLTYELDKVYTVDSFKLICIDLVPLGVGVSDTTVPWLPRSFDILVSTTGEDDSWTVAYSGEDLHDGISETEVYQYVEAEGDLCAYYYMTANFEKAVDAKYIKLGITNLNNDSGTNSGRFFNMSELEVYGTAAGSAPATDAPATDAPATDAPATDAPATDAPATDAPATDAPATDAPATDAPATDAPATDPAPAETPDAPATFDFVIVPVIALAAAAAGVIVLKKKEN